MRVFTLIQVSVFAVVMSALSQSAIGADLYVASGQAAAGELYIINPATGATITDVGPLNDSLGRNYGMTGLAFDPVSGVLYGSSANGNADTSTRDLLVTIDPATALVTPIAVYSTPAGSMTDLSFDPNTHILYGLPSVNGANLYTINPATAEATLVGTGAGFLMTNGGGLAVSSSSVIYGAPETMPPNFGTYDPTSGAYTNIGAPTYPNGRGYGALAFNGSTLYGIEAGTASHLVTIDTTTGAVTDLGATTAQFLDAIAFKPSAGGGVPGDYNSNGVVDAADYVLWRDSVGQATLPNRSPSITGPVGPADYSFWRSHFANTSGSGAGSLSGGAVPEPFSVGLTIIGAACVALVRRSKTK